MRLLLLTVVLATIVPAGAGAQALPRDARALLEDFILSRAVTDLEDATSNDLVALYVAERLKELARPRPIGMAALRTDLQFGAAGGGGSTSLVSRPSVTDLFSAAFESGAVVRQADDEAITFAVNALPLQQLMAGELPRGCGAADETCRVGLGRWLRGLSGSITFNMSDPAKAAGAIDDDIAFLVGRRQVQNVTARYELFVRERDHDELQAGLDAAAGKLSNEAEAFLAAQATFETRLDELLEAASWRTRTIQALNDAVAAHPAASSGERLEVLDRVLLERFEEAFELVRPAPEITMLVAQVQPARDAYVTAMNTLLAEKLYRKAVTLDYAYLRPSDQPVFHQIKAVVAAPLGRRPERVSETRDALPSGMVTANGGFSWFRPEVEGIEGWRVRDSQLSIALDWSPVAWGARRPVYTVAYYFQYMHEDGVLQFNGEAITPGGAEIELPGPAMTVLDTKGAIHVVQFRVSLPAAEGVRFPVAVSYSNRSELITGRGFWQGHLGVSYDFAALKDLVR
jgi:uncharacterized coiled-coil protein SlyX